jgi:glycerol-3-phosphate acyltransferase PlsY
VVAAISTGSLIGAVIAGYLLGSVPVAVLVARRSGVDPRDVGDRNPGYWNVDQQLGRRASVPVFLGDTAKGALAGAVGLALDDSAWGIGWAAVGAAMLGHAFPVFAGFRGGRSILAFAGGMVVLEPLAAAIAIGALGLTWLASRSFAVAARVGVFGFPIAQALVAPIERVAATGALMCIIGARFAQAAWRQRRDQP